jgi:hypothetical protein
MVFSMQPITVHIIRKEQDSSPVHMPNRLTAAGPNPWKPVLVLEELAVPYKLNVFTFAVVKQKTFTDINPNGRAPGTSLLPE